MRRGICKMARMGTMLFIVAFMLTSCAKKPQDISREENEDNLVYSAQYYPVFDYVTNVISAFDYEKNEVIFNCRTDEDYKSNRSLMGVNLDDMQLGEIVDKTDVREYSSFVCWGDYYYAVKDDGVSGAEIVKLDADFKELASVGTNIELPRRYDAAYFDGIKADSEGRLYIMTCSLLQVYDSELNELCRIEVDGNFCGIVTCDDKAYTIEKDGINSILSEINITAQALERVNGSLPGDFVAFCGADGKIYMICAGTMYEYDIDSDSFCNMLSLIEYGIYGPSVRNMYVGNEGSFVFTVEGQYVGYDDFSMGVGILEKVPEVSVSEKKQIIIAAYASDAFYYSMYEYLIKFMRDNPEYTIRFDNYYDDYADSVPLDEFDKMLISGIDADILLIGGFETDKVKNLAQKGILYDINNFLSADEGFKDAIIPNIYEHLKLDGGVYAITPYFYMSTLTGRETVTGEREYWTVHGILEKLKDDESINLFADGDASAALIRLLEGGVCLDEEFIRNEGFTSEKFAELLELCKLCGERNMNTEKIVLNEKAVLEGRAMVVKDSNIFDDVRKYYALFGEDGFARVGYPDEAGGRSVIGWDEFFCISNSSQNKEDAWKLIKSFLSEDYYKNIHNSQAIMYPVVEKMCVEYLNNEIENQETKSIPIYSVDENLVTTTEMVVDVPVITKEQAQVIMDEINTASISGYDIDGTIKDIIREEAQYFFEGQKTAGEVGKIIQDRVQLYLDEKD